MKTLRRGWSRLMGALFGQRRDTELADEIESHIQLFTDDNIRAGMTPAEARRAALLRFGGVAGAATEAIGGQWLGSLLYDVSPSDPVVSVGVLGPTAAAAIAATAAPANRAVNIDPVQAIREE